jgi:hypothetical protein
MMSTAKNATAPSRIVGDDPHAHLRLVSAILRYDKRLTDRDGNTARLPLILAALDRAEAEHSCCWAHRLYDNFCDRLLTALEKSLGLAVTYGRGHTDGERRPTICTNGKASLR